MSTKTFAFKSKETYLPVLSSTAQDDPSHTNQRFLDGQEASPDVETMGVVVTHLLGQRGTGVVADHTNEKRLNRLGYPHIILE